MDLISITQRTKKFRANVEMLKLKLEEIDAQLEELGLKAPGLEALGVEKCEDLRVALEELDEELQELELEGRGLRRRERQELEYTLDDLENTLDNLEDKLDDLEFDLEKLKQPCSRCGKPLVVCGPPEPVEKLRAQGYASTDELEQRVGPASSKRRGARTERNGPQHRAPSQQSLALRQKARRRAARTIARRSRRRNSRRQ